MDPDPTPTPPSLFRSTRIGYNGANIGVPADMALPRKRLANSRGDPFTLEGSMHNIVELGSVEHVRILGLDQDSNCIGWAKGNGPDYQSSGVRRFEGSRDERLAAIYQWVKAVLIEWRPAFYVLEAPMGDHDNPDTHKLLGEVMGICKAAGYETGHDHQVITPYWIRATGYYKETRRETAMLVGKERITGHEADAIGAWLAGWMRHRNLEIQRRVVDHGLIDQG